MKQLYNATVCKFESIDQMDLTERYTIDVDSIKCIVCKIENTKAIDIRTGNDYYLIQKDENGYIKDGQDIKTDVYYAINPEPYTKNSRLNNIVNYLFDSDNYSKTKRKQR